MKKPFKTYNGGKESDGTFQKIINVIPPHDVYIEQFLGNGTIFRYKKAAPVASIGIDLDNSVILKWRYCNPAGITLINTDAISWLENFQVAAAILKNQGTRVFIYLDPPYPKDSRRNSKDLYAHEMTDDQHILLLRTVVNLQHDCDILISSYPNDLYSDVLDNWNTFTFQSQTRNGMATEQVWYNYPEPTELHDYRYLGGDYRERELLKGIIFSNVSKFKRLPDLQRNAIIEQLKNEQIL